MMKPILHTLMTALTMLCISVGTAYAQTRLSGKVTDESGQALPGVAVLVSGTTTGTMTDDNGNYSLSGLKKGTT
ncbi:MAG: carboxypeptidase-like regulatory domain-containing protein, partial [Candidatus Cryptobacteroides sp.]